MSIFLFNITGIFCSEKQAMTRRGEVIEEAKYEVIQIDNKFEIRDYETHILAETLVEGNLEDAGSEGFKRLFRYISGDNRSGDKVAMTAPVSQQPTGEMIKMKAPVGQQRLEESWAVSFMMPGSYTLETLPEPEDPKVTLRQVPRLVGWPQCATPVSGARRATCDTRWNWSHGFTEWALPLWGMPYGLDTPPPLCRGS